MPLNWMLLLVLPSGAAGAAGAAARAIDVHSCFRRRASNTVQSLHLEIAFSFSQHTMEAGVRTAIKQPRGA